MDIRTPKWLCDHLNFQFSEITVLSLAESIPHFGTIESKQAEPKVSGMNIKHFVSESLGLLVRAVNPISIP